MKAQELLALLKVRHDKDIFIPECKNGPTQVSNHVRLDAWAMKRSYTNPLSCGYEIKVSRQDFLNDRKWMAYLPLCNELYFVCPNKLIFPDEVPADAGLIWASKTGNRLVAKKKAPYRNILLPESLYKYILFSRARSFGKENMYISNNVEFWNAWLEEKKANRELGWKVSRALNKRIEEEIIEAKGVNEGLQHQINKLQKIQELVNRLGVGDYPFAIERRLKEIMSGVPDDFKSNVSRLQSDLSRILENLDEMEATR